MRSFNQPRPTLPASLAYPYQPTLYSNKALQNINCIEDAANGYGGLFLGDIISLIKSDIIPRHQISAVLSCMTEVDTAARIPANVTHKSIPAKDSMDYPINIHFEETYNFIESSRASGRNILVHCHAGVSRSAAVVCAYLMKKHKWTLDQALSFMRTKRQRVKPNQNFIDLLKNYESTIVNDTKENYNQPESQKRINEVPYNQRAPEYGRVNAEYYKLTTPARHNSQADILESTRPTMNTLLTVSRVQRNQPLRDSRYSHAQNTVYSNPISHSRILSNVFIQARNPQNAERSLTSNSNQPTLYDSRKKKISGGITCSLSGSRMYASQKSNIETTNKDNQNIRISPFEQDMGDQAPPPPLELKKIVSYDETRVKQVQKSETFGQALKNKISGMFGGSSNNEIKKDQKRRPDPRRRRRDSGAVEDRGCLC